ncbi:hypothetical protein BC826DRAFT_1036540 [Russula brevipes]|nr:hypothetical protein BC826DRAFT_1036540 [Russula brevipes]
MGSAHSVTVPLALARYHLSYSICALCSTYAHCSTPQKLPPKSDIHPFSNCVDISGLDGDHTFRGASANHPGHLSTYSIVRVAV